MAIDLKDLLSEIKQETGVLEDGSKNPIKVYKKGKSKDKKDEKETVQEWELYDILGGGEMNYNHIFRPLAILLSDNTLLQPLKSSSDSGDGFIAVPANVRIKDYVAEQFTERATHNTPNTPLYAVLHQGGHYQVAIRDENNKITIYDMNGKNNLCSDHAMAFVVCELKARYEKAKERIPDDIAEVIATYNTETKPIISPSTGYQHPAKSENDLRNGSTGPAIEAAKNAVKKTINRKIKNVLDQMAPISTPEKAKKVSDEDVRDLVDFIFKNIEYISTHAKDIYLTEEEIKSYNKQASEIDNALTKALKNDQVSMKIINSLAGQSSFLKQVSGLLPYFRQSGNIKKAIADGWTLSIQTDTKATKADGENSPNFYINHLDADRLSQVNRLLAVLNKEQREIKKNQLEEFLNTCVENWSESTKKIKDNKIKNKGVLNIYETVLRAARSWDLDVNKITALVKHEFNIETGLNSHDGNFPRGIAAKQRDEIAKDKIAYENILKSLEELHAVLKGENTLAEKMAQIQLDDLGQRFRDKVISTAFPNGLGDFNEEHLKEVETVLAKIKKNNLKKIDSLYAADIKKDSTGIGKVRFLVEEFKTEDAIFKKYFDLDKGKFQAGFNGIVDKADEGELKTVEAILSAMESVPSLKQTQDFDKHIKYVKEQLEAKKKPAAGASLEKERVEEELKESIRKPEEEFQARKERREMRHTIHGLLALLKLNDSDIQKLVQSSGNNTPITFTNKESETISFNSPSQLTGKDDVQKAAVDQIEQYLKHKQNKQGKSSFAESEMVKYYKILLRELDASKVTEKLPDIDGTRRLVSDKKETLTVRGYLHDLARAKQKHVISTGGGAAKESIRVVIQPKQIQGAEYQLAKVYDDPAANGTTTFGSNEAIIDALSNLKDPVMVKLDSDSDEYIVRGKLSDDGSRVDFCLHNGSGQYVRFITQADVNKYKNTHNKNISEVIMNELVTKMNLSASADVAVTPVDRPKFKP